MRKITFFAACFAACSIGAKAQIIESSWLPSAGIEKNSFVSSNASEFTPGATGEGQTWNFAGLTSISSMSQNIIAADDANGSTQFSSATVAYTDGAISEYYSAGGSAFQAWGFYSGSGEQASYEIYSDAKDLLRFPVGFGQSFTDAFSSENRMSGMSFSFNKTGNVSVQVDGSGTLVTPEGSFDNVLRVKSVETYQLIGLPPTPGASTSGTVTTYSFISPDYPGMYLLKYVISDDGLNDEEIEIYYADAEFVSLGVRISRADVTLFPNPVVDRLTIRNRAEIASVLIVDVNGRTMNYRPISRTANVWVIDVRDLPSGSYLAKIENTNSEIVVKRFNVSN
ncbi:MAG: T9SS type A sorting domain-containing protein [Bacteroidia bacterium]